MGLPYAKVMELALSPAAVAAARCRRRSWEMNPLQLPRRRRQRDAGKVVFWGIMGEKRFVKCATILRGLHTFHYFFWGCCRTSGGNEIFFLTKIVGIVKSWCRSDLWIGLESHFLSLPRGRSRSRPGECYPWVHPRWEGAGGIWKSWMIMDFGRDFFLKMLKSILRAKPSLGWGSSHVGFGLWTCPFMKVQWTAVLVGGPGVAETSAAAFGRCFSADVNFFSVPKRVFHRGISNVRTIKKTRTDVCVDNVHILL